MNHRLTWGDAETCFFAHLKGQEPELSPEKRAEVEKDAARGPESQIRRYIELRLKTMVKYREYLYSQPIEEQLRKMETVKTKMQHQHPGAGKDFQMSVEERIEQMQRLLVTIENRLKSETQLDSFLDRYYHREKGQDNDRGL